MHYHYEGSLTARDAKRCIPQRFGVPAGTGRMELHLRFAPAGAYGIVNLITLTLFDPQGFRGAGLREGDSHWVHLGPAGASPGFLPGPLPGGEWTAEVDTHMIMPGQPVRYSLDITLTEEAGTAAEPAPLPAARPRTAPRGPGWYRGELHSHTYHSDATGRTVAELVQMARGEGLDFIFLTDHNTTAGLAEMDALAADDLLTAGGIELTTFWGHALCLGTRDWVDWRVRPNSGEMERIAAATYGRGQVFVIAHPQSPGDPACTGCSWRFGDMMPGNAEVVEIWNGPWGGDSNNEPSLALWYDWLNQGQRLAATAGTDTHSSRDYAARPGFNVVYAEALTEAALLKAIRAGRLYMSAGPRLGLEARGEGGERWTMGDTAARPATFTAGWAGCPDGARLRVMANGRSLAEQPAAGEGSYTWAMAPGDADWVVVEIRDAGGELLAISNPIYLRP